MSHLLLLFSSVCFQRLYLSFSCETDFHVLAVLFTYVMNLKEKQRGNSTIISPAPWHSFQLWFYFRIIIIKTGCDRQSFSLTVREKTLSQSIINPFFHQISGALQTTPMLCQHNVYLYMYSRHCHIPCIIFSLLVLALSLKSFIVTTHNYTNHSSYPFHSHFHDRHVTYNNEL